jgi:hypothetical protein
VLPHHSCYDRPKSNKVNWPQTETSKTGSQNKPFCFLSWKLHASYYSNRKLTNTVSILEAHPSWGKQCSKHSNAWKMQEGVLIGPKHMCEALKSYSEKLLMSTFQINLERIIKEHMLCMKKCWACHIGPIFPIFSLSRNEAFISIRRSRASSRQECLVLLSLSFWQHLSHKKLWVFVYWTN